MKFLSINKKTYSIVTEEFSNENYINSLTDYSLNYYFEKFFVKKRKLATSVRVGVTKNIKKNSIKRNKNSNLIGLYYNLMHRKGKKLKSLKNVNYAFENLLNSFNDNIDDFNIYKNYSYFVELSNSNSVFSDLIYLLEYSIKDLESIFEIKTKKNHKKLKLSSKYTHEIVYIPKIKRMKYVIKSLCFYKNSFKNYGLWERVFWSFFLTILNRENSFLKRRRNYIYLKSVKFFKIKK